MNAEAARLGVTTRSASGHAIEIAGAVLLALSFAGLVVDAAAFFAAWLAAWWFWLGVVVGALMTQWIHRLSGGRWGDVLRPATAALAERVPRLLLLFVPLLFGIEALYPWARDGSGWSERMARPGFAIAWFDLRFFGARLIGYALIAWSLSRPAATLPSAARAVVSLIVTTFVASLAAVDLLMSLVAGWSSSAFGWVVVSAQLAAGSAAAIALSAWLAHASPAEPPAAPPPDSPSPHRARRPPVWRDLGNYLLMTVMLWGYLAFMEFLIIWAENLPREVTWYMPRLQTAWRLVGAALIVFGLALPMLALVVRRLKDEPRRLGAIAALVFVTQALEAAWLAVPSVAPHSAHAVWLVPLAGLAMGLVLYGGLPARLRARAVGVRGEST